MLVFLLRCILVVFKVCILSLNFKYVLGEIGIIKEDKGSSCMKNVEWYHQSLNIYNFCLKYFLKPESGMNSA